MDGIRLLDFFDEEEISRGRPVSGVWLVGSASYIVVRVNRLLIPVFWSEIYSQSNPSL